MDNYCLICNLPINPNILLCEECDTKLFELLRDYINNNPNAKTSDIFENTKIPLILLKRFLDDPRFEYVGKKLKTTNDICFYCGNKVDEGKTYCHSCLNNLKLIGRYKNLDIQSFENSSKTYVESGTYKHLKIKKR